MKHLRIKSQPQIGILHNQRLLKNQEHKTESKIISTAASPRRPSTMIELPNIAEQYKDLLLSQSQSMLDSDRDSYQRNDQPKKLASHQITERNNLNHNRSQKHIYSEEIILQLSPRKEPNALIKRNVRHHVQQGSYNQQQQEGPYVLLRGRTGSRGNSVQSSEGDQF